jgi:lactose/L-arabinose transport system permease protein
MERGKGVWENHLYEETGWSMKKKLEIKHGLSTKAAPYLFMTPGLILFLLFGIYPIIQSFIYSFNHKIGTQPSTFVGLENYVRAFSDHIFLISLKNIFVIFFLHAPFMIMLSLVVAGILNLKTTKYGGAFRTIYFLPNVMNGVAYTLLFKIFFLNDGVFNEFLTRIGLDPILWISDPLLMKGVISIMTVWRWTGYNMVIFLAAMQNISPDLYEAAEMEGAGLVQQFFRITVPMLKDPIMFTLIMTINGTLNIFTEAQLLTSEGGPNFGTYTPILHIFNTAWKQFDFGYASAMSYILAMITIIIAIIQFNIGKSQDDK